MAGFDTNDTDLGTTSPQKLANEVREPNAYILVLNLVCFKCEIDHLACNRRERGIEANEKERNWKKREKKEEREAESWGLGRRQTRERKMKKVAILRAEGRFYRRRR